jgi:CHASE2 domain-containing sensor protein
MPISIPIERYFDARRLRGRSIDFWLRAIAATLIGIVAADLLGEFQAWNRLRYFGYNLIQQIHRRGSTYSKMTAVVLIDDEDYWRGKFARRTPLKRDELASLIRRVAGEEPNVIGLDVDLSSQVPDGSLRWHGSYDGETRILLATLQEISQRIPIVLAKNVHVDPDTGAFIPESDIFDGLQTSRLSAGYVLLPHDVRQLTTSLEDHRKENLPSFPILVARFADPNSLAKVDERSTHAMPFAWFLTKEGFKDRWLYSSTLFRHPKGSFHALKGRAVIIGGAWSERGYGRGDVVDLHLTPVGKIPGAALLANYVETLLSEDATPSLGQTATRVIELAFGIMLACIFVCGVGPWKGVLVAFTMTWSAIFSVIFFQNFGVFLDAVPLVVALLAHTIYEQVLEWKADADHHCKTCLKADDSGEPKEQVALETTPAVS